MPSFRHYNAALCALVLWTTAAAGQEPAADPKDPDAAPATGKTAGSVPEVLRSTLEALGASTGVPDGGGLSWYPRESVRGQSAQMGFANYQFGITAPVVTTDTDLVFANASARVLAIRSNARLETDHVRFPRSFSDYQAGGGFVHQFGDGWSWGTALNLGTASDRPFNGLAEMTLSALAFLRKPDGDKNGWLFYVVSASNGQLGRNIPVPGVAYEYHNYRLTAVLGFPFVTIDYRPIDSVQIEFNYAALTDVLFRTSYHFTDHARVFADYQWTNVAWFRADRMNKKDQTFLYQQQIEGGFGWQANQRVDFRLTGGYAFNRFFVENPGLGFHGRNRTDIAPGPFLAGQLEFKY